jgi:hypothetical protein
VGDGKPAGRPSEAEPAAAVLLDTIQQETAAGLRGLTDVHNNEAFIAGKLVSTNNGASSTMAWYRKESDRREDPVIERGGGRVVRAHRRVQHGHLQAD